MAYPNSISRECSTYHWPTDGVANWSRFPVQVWPCDWTWCKFVRSIATTNDESFIFKLIFKQNYGQKVVGKKWSQDSEGFERLKKVIPVRSSSTDFHALTTNCDPKQSCQNFLRLFDLGSFRMLACACSGFSGGGIGNPRPRSENHDSQPNLTKSDIKFK